MNSSNSFINFVLYEFELFDEEDEEDEDEDDFEDLSDFDLVGAGAGAGAGACGNISCKRGILNCCEYAATAAATFGSEKSGKPEAADGTDDDETDAEF